MTLAAKKSVYVDTNEFVYARASESFPSKHRNLGYYKSGKECMKVLQTCRRNNIVVFSSVITRIEMEAQHLDWAKKKRLVDFNLPLGFAFGESHRNEDGTFIQQLFTKTDRIAVYEELNDWFRSWRFNALVRWMSPKDIPFWGELTRIAFRYVPRGQLGDAFHIGASIGLQCNWLFTNDSGLRKAITDMRQDVDLRRELKKNGYIDEGYLLPDALSGFNGLPQ